MKILLVTAHPRSDSLTFAAAKAFAEAAQKKGHEIEVADLMSEGFDPVLLQPDEPDWADPNKLYSAAVQSEMARIERNEATVMVFPVWWWSMPALLKGWIDRVWNNGWAYGDRTYPHNRAWMLAVAGTSAEAYAKRGYDEAMRTQLETGILQYCGIRETRLELLFGSIEGAPGPKTILETARRLGSEF
ncbi:NAD(P)H oxidoreductase [Hyphomicrobium sp. 99]|uniref:NAD(P)H oxidoreductase n=1 Tax=Hyphomicrobium sp. 99 TaxID=1163419 RepID=UPI0005F860ED|nr:NAD(P)H oxidoreductase [Hyphomicrobium sp. 99]